MSLPPDRWWIGCWTRSIPTDGFIDVTADFPFWSAGYVAHPDLAESHRAHGTAHSSCGRVIPGWKLAVADTATQESRLADTAGWTHHVAVAPSRFAIEGARAYANLKGFTDPHDTDYSQIMQSPERVARVGRHYDSLPTYSPAAVPHFAAMQKEVNDQYDFLTNNMGIKVQPVDYDPYAHVGELMADVHNNGTLKVLGSHVTGGHPVFGNDDNDKFRAVHDFFGHAATGRDFDRHGEHATYLAHSRMFSPQALPALTTETLGQNSSLILNGHFGPNKIGVIPRELTAHRTASQDLSGIEFGMGDRPPGLYREDMELPYDRHYETTAVDTATGRQVGWLSRQHDGEIHEIAVHPDYRRRGIGTALFNWTKTHVDPETHHSTEMTDDGLAWAQSMGWNPEHRSDKDMSDEFGSADQMPLHTGPTYKFDGSPHIASRTAMPYDDEDREEEEEDEDDGTYCKDCGKGDGDWCEDCETCSHCDDSHEAHCKNCGPNDSDWCSDCEQCSNCDWEHDAHCSYCGPNDSDWCEDCQQCNSCDGLCEHKESDSRPSSLNSPLFRDRERPLTNEYSSQGERMHLFLPHDVNPASEAVSRPYIDFEREPDPYDTPALDLKLPPARWTSHDRPLHEHSNGIDGIPVRSKGVELFRGLTVDLKHPELAPLRRAIYGDEKESFYSGDPNSAYSPPKRRFKPRDVHQPGMFSGPYSDKELAAKPAHPDRLHQYRDMLLNHMDNHGDKLGLGVHWSTDIDQANQFANASSSFNRQNNLLPVRMKARWFGRGEDPYRRNTGEETPGDYEYERELSMLPGAPLNLTDLEILHPETREWHSLMDGDPHRIHAGRDFIGSLSAQFPDVMALLRNRKE